MQNHTPFTEEDRALRAQRLQRIGLREISSTLPHLKLEGKSVQIRRANYQKHYYDIKVSDVDHLKSLVGNPDRSLELIGMQDYKPHPMHPTQVPDGNVEDFSKLSRIQQVSVHKAAKNIIYGHSQALTLSETQFANVAGWILKYTATIPVFYAPSFEVMNGTTVTLLDAAVLHFQTVTVHGTGSIRFENSTKVYVDNMVVTP